LFPISNFGSLEQGWSEIKASFATVDLVLLAIPLYNFSLKWTQPSSLFKGLVTQT